MVINLMIRKNLRLFVKKKKMSREKRTEVGDWGNSGPVLHKSIEESKLYIDIADAKISTMRARER